MNRKLPPHALALALSPLLVLGGCGTQSTKQAGQSASGEVLPGTVSDAMLNTDQSQAEPPLAPVAHSTADKTDTKTAATASDPAADASAGAAVAAEPAEAPSPAASAPKPKPAASPKPPAP